MAGIGSPVDPQRTLQFINRGHSAETFLDAVRRASGKNIHICTHIIVGLPGETQEDMLETARVTCNAPDSGNQNSSAPRPQRER